MIYEPIKKERAFQVRAWVVKMYQRERRKHAHRCTFCSRVLKPGDEAVMWRMRGRLGTAACHRDCSDGISDGVPKRAIIDVWAYGDEGREHARGQGFEV